MTNIKKSINTIRNKIVANNSKISKNKVIDDSVIKDLKEEVYCEEYNFVGKIPITPVGDFRCRQVENGKDIYYVAEGYKKMQRKVFFGNPKDYTPATVDTFVRSFVVKHGEDTETLTIQSNQTIREGDGFVYPKSVMFCGKGYSLDPGTDISDINQVRYQLRNIEAVSHFLDKFVIVSDKEKQAYRKYEAEILKEEKLCKLRRCVSKVASKVASTVDGIGNTVKCARNTYKEKRNAKEEYKKNKRRQEYFTGRK